MKTTLLTGLVLALVLLPGIGRAQTYQTTDDCAFIKTKHNFHYVGDDQPLRDEDFEGVPALLPKQAPIVPATPHPIEVAESDRAYTDGKYDEAAALVADAANLTPADPSVLNCYARALYRGANTRELSYPVYQRLIALLDMYGRESPQAVTVYMPFVEAYFKLATLQLDDQQWAAASYNLSRAAAALQSMPDAAAENSSLREQILQYQTECFANLHQLELCRYFGQRTLKFFPGNRYVKPYLAALPKPKPAPRR
ncbi:hypothetical protein [Hymenobacter baengnokdamensis]|uniref:hypothetical protein n=1 Tax=Hymenobacter baengnokdamensis TaxID=2615203 RepID=UPI00124925E1|nr:hypothetical protein [Hymenobacter baengnokdamensis]